MKGGNEEGRINAQIWDSSFCSGEVKGGWSAPLRYDELRPSVLYAGDGLGHWWVLPMVNMIIKIYNLCDFSTKEHTECKEHFCFSLRSSAHSAVKIEIIPAHVSCFNLPPRPTAATEGARVLCDAGGDLGSGGCGGPPATTIKIYNLSDF